MKAITEKNRHKLFWNAIGLSIIFCIIVAILPLLAIGLMLIWPLLVAVVVCLGIESYAEWVSGSDSGFVGGLLIIVCCVVWGLHLVINLGESTGIHRQTIRWLMGIYPATFEAIGGLL